MNFKKLAIQNLKKLTTSILSHTVVPGAIFGAFVVALFTQGPALPILIAFFAYLPVYLVGDVLDQKIDSYIEEFDDE